MLKQNILRTFLFVVFFSIGAAALSGSILCEELLRYYQNKQLLRQAEECLKRLETLNTDYDILLGQLGKDPNFVRRIAPATLGTEPKDEDAIYPRATAEQLAAVRGVLEDSGRKVVEPEIPDWIMRCSKPPQRIILFLAGAFLIFISFIFFGPAKQLPKGEK